MCLPAYGYLMLLNSSVCLLNIIIIVVIGIIVMIIFIIINVVDITIIIVVIGIIIILLLILIFEQHALKKKLKKTLLHGRSRAFQLSGSLTAIAASLHLTVTRSEYFLRTIGVC